HLPGLGPLCAYEFEDGVLVEVLLAGEMLVEAAAGQPGCSHDLVDRHVGEPVAIEQPPRALDDALPRRLLVLFRVGHLPGLPLPDRDDSSMTKDVLEHLLCALLMKAPSWTAAVAPRQNRRSPK